MHAYDNENIIAYDVLFRIIICTTHILCVHKDKTGK
jgi:hypothetical protein